MIVYDVAEKFSKYPGGRFAKHGPHSGEEFLYKHLIPLWKQYDENQERIRLDFTNCIGATGGFLDQSLGELAKVFDVDAVNTRFEFVGRHISDDLPEILETAAKTGRVETPELKKAKATEEQRRHVQNFMEWCEDQEPPLHLAQHDPKDQRGYIVNDVPWKVWCTKWCEIDEQKIEREKLLLLAKIREQNDLLEKAKNWRMPRG